MLGVKFMIWSTTVLVDIMAMVAGGWCILMAVAIVAAIIISAAEEVRKWRAKK